MSMWSLSEDASDSEAPGQSDLRRLCFVLSLLCAFSAMTVLVSGVLHFSVGNVSLLSVVEGATKMSALKLAAKLGPSSHAKTFQVVCRVTFHFASGLCTARDVPSLTTLSSYVLSNP